MRETKILRVLGKVANGIVSGLTHIRQDESFKKATDIQRFEITLTPKNQNTMQL
jgi:hypothetical protein